MQLGHGKESPLRRLRPGDGIVYYSPSTIHGVKDGLQSFTAIGTVAGKEPYRVDMEGGFHPFRRDVHWVDAKAAPIRPLVDRLGFTAGHPNWGRKLRFGLVQVSDSDFRLIAAAMEARLDLPAARCQST